MTRRSIILKKVYQTNHIKYIDPFINYSEAVGVPVPNAIKRKAKKLRKELDSMPNQIYSTDQNKQWQINQQDIIQFFATKLKQEKDFYRENIEASKSLQQVSSLKQMLDVIKKQRQQQQQTDVCLGCLKELEEGKPMPETTQLYSLVNGKSINTLLEDNVKKKPCALLNGQGGYLFIGESINKQQVKGLTLNEGEMYQLKKFVQKTIKKSIFPSTFEIKINTIQTKKSNGKTSKPILLVSLRPSGGNGFYFVEKEVPKYPSVYSCYFLDTNSIGEINDVCVFEKPESIYQILTKHRGFKNPEQIVHKQGCVSRNNAMQNLFYKINLKQKFKQLTNVKPKTNYRKQSILIIHKHKDDQYIPQIQKMLVSKNLTSIIFTKPFQLCRSNSMKSIWFISHSYNLPQLQSIIKEVMKSRPFTLLSFTQYLLVYNVLLCDLNNYFATYKQFFTSTPEIYGMQTNQQSYNLYLKFPGYSQSFLFYSGLDNLGKKSITLKDVQYHDNVKNLRKISFNL